MLMDDVNNTPNNEDPVMHRIGSDLPLQLPQLATRHIIMAPSLWLPVHRIEAVRPVQEGCEPKSNSHQTALKVLPAFNPLTPRKSAPGNIAPTT